MKVCIIFGGSELFKTYFKSVLIRQKSTFCFTPFLKLHNQYCHSCQFWSRAKVQPSSGLIHNGRCKGDLISKLMIDKMHAEECSFYEYLIKFYIDVNSLSIFICAKVHIFKKHWKIILQNNSFTLFLDAPVFLTVVPINNERAKRC